LRSITSLQRTVSTPPLVDFSRASPLDLFEQPAKRLFSSVAAEQQASPVAANGPCTLRKSADLIQSRNHREKSKPLPSTSHVDVTCTPISALYEAYSSACTDPIPLELGTQMFVLQWTLPATTQLFAIWAATKAQPVVEKWAIEAFPGILLHANIRWREINTSPYAVRNVCVYRRRNTIKSTPGS
jgi:hypothetical protein